MKNKTMVRSVCIHTTFTYIIHTCIYIIYIYIYIYICKTKPKRNTGIFILVQMCVHIGVVVCMHTHAWKMCNQYVNIIYSKYVCICLYVCMCVCVRDLQVLGLRHKDIISIFVCLYVCVTRRRLAYGCIYMGYLHTYIYTCVYACIDAVKTTCSESDSSTILCPYAHAHRMCI